jgi:outer membrane protein assembly factor BamB
MIHPSIEGCYRMNSFRFRFRRGANGVVLLAGLCTIPHLATAADLNAHWPGFRGFRQSVTPQAGLPLHWSDADNVAWRVTLPGTGQSSPVIWGGRVFVTAIEGARKETLRVLAIDLNSGRELWQREWTSSFPEQDSDYMSRAAPTPAVDAERVYVLFESGDLFALSHEGEEIWHRELTQDFGPFEGNHGQGSSPLLVDDSVVVLMDHKGPSFIAAFDRAAGTTRWKTDRSTSSAWSSPVLTERHGQVEILTSASGSVTAYDPTDGSVRWSYEGLEGNNVPSPSTDGDLVLVGSRKKGANLALRVAADGATTVAWVSADATSAFGSPLLHQGRAYIVNDAGVAFCHRLDTGELLWDARIGDSTWAAPLAAGERVYLFSKNGRTTVLRAADTFEVIAQNQLAVDAKDRVYGYAIAENRFVFRFGHHLLCVTN